MTIGHKSRLEMFYSIGNGVAKRGLNREFVKMMSFLFACTKLEEKLFPLLENVA